LFRGPAAERRDDPAAQVALRIVIAVVDRLAVGRSQRHAAGDDGHLLHRVGSWYEQTHQRVSRLVIRDQPLLVLTEHDRTAQAEDRALDGVLEIIAGHLLVSLAGGEIGRASCRERGERWGGWRPV